MTTGGPPNQRMINSINLAEGSPLLGDSNGDSNGALLDNQRHD